jgi:hypothetical protein
LPWQTVREGLDEGTGTLRASPQPLTDPQGARNPPAEIGMAVGRAPVIGFRSDFKIWVAAQPTDFRKHPRTVGVGKRSAQEQSIRGATCMFLCFPLEAIG